MTECSGCLQKVKVIICNSCGFEYCNDCMLSKELHTPCDNLTDPTKESIAYTCQNCDEICLTELLHMCHTCGSASCVDCTDGELCNLCNAPNCWNCSGMRICCSD